MQSAVQRYWLRSPCKDLVNRHALQEQYLQCVLTRTRTNKPIGGQCRKKGVYVRVCRRTYLEEVVHAL